MITTIPSSRLKLPDADRIGVATSVLCAIHCGLAPVLLIALPTFGRIWAHPASHALVAIFIVPLAVFSIRKGYQRHRQRWVAAVATIGVLSVLVGAALPALTTPKEILPPAASPSSDGMVTASEVSTEEEAACCASCELCAEGDESAVAATTVAATTAGTPAAATTVGCVDNCCPSAQVNADGEISLHIPPAAIVTTLGGVFLITAHVGNLLGCRRLCAESDCGCAG